MKIPGDELGRSWTEAQLENGERMAAGLVTLVGIAPTGEPGVVGNAFIIYGNKRGALCVTASHNFEYLNAMQKRSRVVEHPTLPPDFRCRGPKYLNREGCAAVYVVGKDLFQCQIGQVNYVGNYDVALFTIHSDDAACSFDSKFAIDFRIPRVGDEVGYLSYVYRKFEHEGREAVEGKLQLVAGVVTERSVAEDRYKHFATFRTTMPMPPGVSGAPIIWKPEPAKPAIVCGVASYDFSDPQSYKSYMTPGNSAGACLWPAMGLGFEMAIEGENPGPQLLATLAHRGFLDDRSVGVSVSASVNAEHTSIVYSDKSSDPPEVIVMTTAPHPLMSTIQY